MKRTLLFTMIALSSLNAFASADSAKQLSGTFCRGAGSNFDLGFDIVTADAKKTDDMSLRLGQSISDVSFKVSGTDGQTGILTVIDGLGKYNLVTLVSDKGGNKIYLACGPLDQ